MLGVLILRLSTILLLDFGTVPTAFFILLFQICMYVCMYIKLTFYLIVINKYYNEMETQHEYKKMIQISMDLHMNWMISFALHVNIKNRNIQKKHSNDLSIEG
jgi:hypothetical protein